MREIKHLSWNEFLDEFDSSVHGALNELRMRKGITGIVALQCEVMDSSRLGNKTAMIYGPDCTLKSLEQIQSMQGGVYTTGLPSSAAFPYAYTIDVGEDEWPKHREPTGPGYTEE